MKAMLLCAQSIYIVFTLSIACTPRGVVFKLQSKLNLMYTVNSFLSL